LGVCFSQRRRRGVSLRTWEKRRSAAFGFSFSCLQEGKRMGGQQGNFHLLNGALLLGKFCCRRPASRWGRMGRKTMGLHQICKQINTGSAGRCFLGQL
jgi:hypothetical protein